MDTIYASFRHIIEKDLDLIKYYAMNRNATDGASVATFYQMVASREGVSSETKISNDINAILDYFEFAVDGGVVHGRPELREVAKALPLLNLENYMASDTTPSTQCVLQYAIESLDTLNPRVRISVEWAQYYEPMNPTTYSF